MARSILRLPGGTLLDRRRFLTATTGLAATVTFRGNLLAQLEKAPSTLPDHSLFQKNEDAYWVTGPNYPANSSSPKSDAHNGHIEVTMYATMCP